MKFIRGFLLVLYAAWLLVSVLLVVVALTAILGAVISFVFQTNSPGVVVIGYIIMIFACMAWVLYDTTKFSDFGIETHAMSVWKSLMLVYPIAMPAYMVFSKIVWPRQIESLEEYKERVGKTIVPFDELTPK